MSNLTMTDLFCGAGGSSTGAVSVPGVSVRLAANHWDRAIETHNTNHPDVDHLQADISNTDPRYVPTTDILWASPECTNHSRAKGRKAHRQPDLFGDVLPDEAAERSRATMWDVVRFAETHHYRAVLVENVVEVVDWSAEWGVKGGLFQSWLGAMHAMGYRHHIVSMNSMHAQGYGLPAPQSRDRVYIAFWRQGERAPDFERMQRPRAYCPRCDEVVDAMQWWKKVDGQARPGRYRSQYLYRCPNVTCRNEVVEPAWLPASSIIDWSNPGTRIGDRDKPLADKTMRRIQVGIERYWSPILAENGGNPYDAADPKHPGFGNPGSYYRAWPITDPTQTMHTRESKGLAYHPLMVPVEGREGKEARIAAEAARTMTTRNETGLALPPFLLDRRFEYRARDLDDPMPTLTANDTSKALVHPPFIAELRGGGSTARLADDPLATVTASGNHHALILRNNGGGAEMTTPASEPVRTVTTAGHQSLLTGGTVNIDDVRFRMLEPDEIKQAMAFPADYVVVGNRREQVKLSGNAVTPPAARDLVATVAAAITGEDVAA
ncbi:DNA cytosine methyltransferase [Cellulosimicrobium sp. CpK407]|uniref:DNA cytosine methyltransferase n=1 Tax=Cellulosimicrobium sp. CpK407 TaxID=3229847 RepID=UPI003F2DA78C